MKVVYLVVTTSNLNGLIAIHDTLGWRLPRVESPDSLSRYGVAQRIRDTIDSMISADVVHWAPLPLNTCQTKDQYCIAIAHTSHLKNERSSGSVFLDEEQFLPESPSMVEHLAVRTAFSRLERPVAAFDSPERVAQTLAWGQDQFANATGTLPKVMTWHRGGRYKQVIRFEAGSDAAFLKAEADRVQFESLLTQYLWALRPHQLPETIAVDPQGYGWLCRELRGTPMRAATLTTDIIVTIVRALASLQMETIASPAVAAHLEQRRRTAVALLHEVNDAIERNWRSLPQDSADAQLIDIWKTMEPAIVRKCAAFDALDVPAALVLADLAGENVILAPGGGVGFIDVVDAYWTSPVVSLWGFVRALQRRHPCRGLFLNPAMHQAVVDSFVAEWSRVVPPLGMREAAAQLWLPGRLLEILMAANSLNRYEQAIGTELSTTYRAARLAVHIRELLRSFGERSLMSPRSSVEAESALAFR